MTERVRVRDVGRRTTANLALPAGGIRRPQLRRLTYWGRRSCGNPWSLPAMPRFELGGRHRVGRRKAFLKNSHLFYQDKKIWKHLRIGDG